MDLLCDLKNLKGQISGICTRENSTLLINVKNSKVVGIIILSFVLACRNENYLEVFNSIF